MRILRLLIAGTLLLCAVCAAAQSAPQIFVLQTDGWRVHLGDDPAWASSAFDDSAWTVTNLNRVTFPRELLAGHSRWFRKRIPLSSQPGPMQLVVSTYDGSYEVYVDGRRVSPPIQSSLRWQSNVTRIYPLREAGNAGGGDVEVAIRSHLYDQVYWFIAPPAVGIGNPAGAARFKRAEDGRVLGFVGFPITVCGIMVLAGGILLSLYAQQRGRREYLWLGLCVLCSGLSNLLPVAGVYLPNSWNGFLGDPCEYWFFATYIEFVYAFVGRTPQRPVRAYQWVLVAAPFAISPVAWAGVFGANTYTWLENCLVFPGIVLPVTMLVVWARRGNREAAVLIGPMLLANLGFWVAGIQVGVQALHPSFTGVPALHLGLVVIDYLPVSQAIFLLAIGLVIFLRFVRVSREQVQTQAELEAARAVQQVLIPNALPAVPGFRIDSVYHPAQQVGGDFFQIIPLRTGGVLAAVGDVSGKGMPAALTVALVVGTLRTLAEITSSPAEILSGLNRRLEGRSAGFTTCLVVRILPGGEATLSSAGHLNPYVSSPQALPSEVPVAAGLPLGLAADSAYTDVPLNLAPGETITFLSDGVVEARNAQGELFGFERACALAAQPASRIAKTAEEFGQDDDITVVTLTLTGAAVPA